MATSQPPASEGITQRTKETPDPSSSTAQYVTDGALETLPPDGLNAYRGKYIPNTPLAASLVSALLGVTFTLGCVLFFNPNAFLERIVPIQEQRDRWSTLGFFFAALAAFHWGEYAVAAGWNRKRCSVDCE